jgi:hypothetical protein
MITEWNVMFQSRLFRLRHCLAFGFEPEVGMWVIFDPHRYGTDIDILTPAKFDLWIAAEAPRAEVLRIGSDHKASPLFPGLWCVGAVKRLVGLRSGALSVGGFRRDLLRAGARKVFARESQNPRPHA